MRFNPIQLQGVGHTAWEVQITRIFGIGISLEWFSSREGYEWGNIGVCDIALSRGKVSAILKGTIVNECCLSVVPKTYRWGRGVEFVSISWCTYRLWHRSLLMLYHQTNICCFFFHYSHKYLVSGYGIAIKSYGHRVQPMSIEDDIVAFLDANDQLKHQVPKTS